jgi:hypothetical protein
MSARTVTRPPWVNAVDLGNAVVVVDVRSNRLDVLLGDARLTWAALASTGEQHAAALVAGVPLDRISSLVRYLTGRGLLTAVGTPQPWPAPTPAAARQASWGTSDSPARLDPSPSAPRTWRARAVAALALTLTVQHTTRRRRCFARVVNLAGIAGRRARPATAAEARHAVNAVRRVARHVPARVACFEESIAAAVTLAIAGRRATWCHGVAGDPLRFHAWLAVNEQSVEEPPTTSEYTVLLKIGPGHGDRKGQSWQNR